MIKITSRNVARIDKKSNDNLQLQKLGISAPSWSIFNLPMEKKLPFPMAAIPLGT